MYAGGMTVREIQGHLREIYGTEISVDLISRVTDAVIDELKLWQQRPLDPVYPIVYLDALVVKVRDQGIVQNKAARTSRSASASTAPRTCSASGSRPTRARSFGSR